MWRVPAYMFKYSRFCFSGAPRKYGTYHIPIADRRAQRSAASKKLVTLDWYCDFAMICASPCPEPGTSQSCFGSRAAAKFLKLLSAGTTGISLLMNDQQWPGTDFGDHVHRPDASHINSRSQVGDGDRYGCKWEGGKMNEMFEGGSDHAWGIAEAGIIYDRADALVFRRRQDGRSSAHGYAEDANSVCVDITSPGCIVNHRDHIVLLQSAHCHVLAAAWHARPGVVGQDAESRVMEKFGNRQHLILRIAVATRQDYQ
jgi:hypothetical protein